MVVVSYERRKFYERVNMITIEGNGDQIFRENRRDDNTRASRK